MKKVWLSLFCITLCAPTLWAQGLDFFHGSWEEALKAAKEQEKLIFVDAYAKWCGPCKRMAATVFKDESVGNFYNPNFISLKLDMEEEEAATFRAKYPVSAYPTLFFIDAEGKVIKKQTGGMPADKFIDLAKSVLAQNDKSANFEKEYDQRKAEPEFILAYVQALNKAGKSPLKIANEFLNTQKDYTAPTVQKIIFEATTEADSRVFDLFVNQKSALASLYGEAAVQEKIEKACQKTARKATEYKSATLLQEAQNKYKTHLPDKAKAFNMTTDMQYCLATKDAKGYLKAAEVYRKEVVKNDASKLHDLATKLVEYFGNDKAALKEAEKLAEKAADNGGLAEYHYTYAAILAKNGNTKAAMKAATKSVQVAKESGKSLPAAERLLEELKNEKE